MRNFGFGFFCKLEMAKKVFNFASYEDTNGLRSSTLQIFQVLCVLFIMMKLLTFSSIFKRYFVVWCEKPDSKLIISDPKHSIKAPILEKYTKIQECYKMCKSQLHYKLKTASPIPTWIRSFSSLLVNKDPTSSPKNLTNLQETLLLLLCRL